MTQTPGPGPQNLTNEKSAQSPAPGAAPLPPVAAPADVETNSDAKTMALLCYILCIFTTFLGPLIIWLIKKDKSPFVDDQGKETLNWGIMVAAASVAIIILMSILPWALWTILSLLRFGVFAVNAVFCIMGAIKVNQGQKYRFPFLLKIVK